MMIQNLNAAERVSYSTNLIHDRQDTFNCFIVKKRFWGHVNRFTDTLVVQWRPVLNK